MSRSICHDKMSRKGVILVIMVVVSCFSEVQTKPVISRFSECRQAYKIINLCKTTQIIITNIFPDRQTREIPKGYETSKIPRLQVINVSSGSSGVYFPQWLHRSPHRNTSHIRKQAKHLESLASPHRPHSSSLRELCKFQVLHNINYNADLSIN